MFKIADIHLITQDTEGFSHSELAEQACEGGAEWIQLRVKGKTSEELLKIASEVRAVCDKFGAKLIINDFPEVAKAARADGVHLGKTDMNAEEARQLLGEEFIIGGTANTFEDIQKLASAKVNYIGLGPFRFTSTKKNLSPILGLDGYKRIIEQCCNASINIPVIAIGGIVPEDIDAIIATGIHGVAISSAVNLASDKPAAMNTFLEKMREVKF